ncbi:MAG: hypothetical protein J5965_20560 [Aeriscardovia sp.]|nr:hypothetical protein [Aeriscardovia sp.]
MKGLVKVSPQGLIDTTKKVCAYMDNFDIEPHKYTEKKFSIFKMKYVERTYYDCPFWHQYRNSLKEHLFKLKNMAENAIVNDDELWLSELSYCNLVMLSKGDKNANPIFIMNY